MWILHTWIYHVDDSHDGTKARTDQRMFQNYLTGNLCRCTGKDNMQNIDPMTYIPLKNRFHTDGISTDLHKICQSTHVELMAIVISPTSLESALQLIQSEKPQLIAGSTDLGVQINKGRNTNTSFMSLALYPKPVLPTDEGDSVRIGASVTWESILKILRTLLQSFLILFTYLPLRRLRMSVLWGNGQMHHQFADSIGYLMIRKRQCIWLVLMRFEGCAHCRFLHSGIRNSIWSKEKSSCRFLFRKPKGVKSNDIKNLQNTGLERLGYFRQCFYTARREEWHVQDIKPSLRRYRSYCEKDYGNGSGFVGSRCE